MSDDISVGSVTVEVLPSTRKFTPDLKAKLGNTSVEVGVTANTKRAEAEIDKATRDRTVRVDVTGGRGFSTFAQGLIGAAPLLGPVTAGIAGLSTALLAPALTAAGGLTIGGFLSGAAVKQTEDQKKQVDALHKSVLAAQQSLANTQASSAASGANSSAAAQRSAVQQLAAAQAQAQKSIAAAQLSGAQASTAAGRASAAQRVESAKSTLAARQSAIQTSLNNRQLTAAASAAASQAAAQRRVTEATVAYQAALKGLTPAQTAFLRAQSDVKGSFETLVKSNGGALLRPVTAGLDTLSSILPKLGPLIVPVSDSISTLLRDVDQYAESKGFDRLVSGFGTAAGRDILTFGRDAENVLTGTYGLLRQFGPLTTDFESWLSRITSTYAKFGQGADSNPAVQQFVSYLRKEGPQVAQTVESVATAVGHVVVALAPIGGLELNGIKALADDINKIPIGVLRTVGIEAAGLFTVFKGAQVISAVDTKLTSLSQTLGKLSINGTDGGALGKAQTAVRGFAGASGLGLIGVGVTNANQNLGLLETVGGGALAGFAVGGPIGAGVGALGAGIAQLGLKSIQAGKDASFSIGNWKDLESTLDSVTGKVTGYTKAAELQRLAKDPRLFQITNSLGFSHRDVVSAAVDGGTTAALLRNRLNTQKQVLADNAAANIALLRAKEVNSPYASRAYDRQINAIKTETAARLANIAAVLTELGAVGQSVKTKKADLNAIADYGPALGKLPKSAQILVNTKGLFTTKNDIAGLAKQLTDKQVRLVIGLTHTDTTVAAIRKVQDAVDKAAKPRTISFAVKTLGLANTLNGAPVQGGIAQLLTPRIPRHADGGLIGGSGTGTSDSNLIAASRGEFMLRKSAVDRYGPQFLQALNTQQLQLADAPPAAPAAGGGGRMEIQGTLGLDASGNAYITGVVRHELSAYHKSVVQNVRKNVGHYHPHEVQVPH